jgi:hypothetical protein
MPLVVSSSAHSGQQSALDTTNALAQESQSVTSITIEETTIQAGETTTITAVVENTASERQTINTTLALDGEQRATRRPSVDPDFPVLVRFETTVDDPGEYTVSVNGVDAEQTLTVQSPSGDSSETDDGSNSDEGSDGAGDSGGSDDSGGESVRTVSVSSENITVESVEIAPTSASPGDTVEVTAILANASPEIVNVSLGLELDGEVVETATAENILSQVNSPGLTLPYTFEYEPEEAGTYTVSVNGTEAGSELDVSGGGGGGLFGFLGFLPLGFLPLGILRLFAVFVVLPLAVVYLALKGLAIYLGY